MSYYVIGGRYDDGVSGYAREDQLVVEIGGVEFFDAVFSFEQEEDVGRSDFDYLFVE